MKFLRYLHFLFSATNQYGVHSPFVYHFLTRSLYSRRLANTDRCTDILFKCIDYFKVARVQMTRPDPALEQLLKSRFPGVRQVSEAADLLVLNADEAATFTLPAIARETLSNDMVVWVPRPYRNKEFLLRWHTMKADPRVRLSIDLFYAGLLFFRKEQARQHFKIRI